MAHLHAFSMVTCITIYLFYFTSSESKGFSLKLIPIFSPESPLYPGNLTQVERTQKMVEISQARANYLKSMSSLNASIELQNIHLPVHERNYLYSVEVFLGTPIKSQFLLVDTGSFLIWTQCLPCINCFDQTNPIFDPNTSSTYQKLPCYHPLCRNPFRCENEECVYRTTYGGGASTSGFASLETFSFPSNNTFRSVPGMIFGCSNDNRNFLFRGNISGILGLSRYRLSLLGQLSKIVQGRFSYCLVYSYREMEATSILKFGDDATMWSTDFQTTPILRQNISPNYYLNLLDIGVGDHRIGLAPRTFALHTNGTGGCIIDTGAIATFIEKGAYEIVMRVFDEHFSSFGCQRFQNSTGGWEYCYIYNPRFRAYTSMTFHFQEAEFKVEPTYMYFIYPNRGYFCIALSSFKDKTILGAWQQQDTQFLYDLNIGSLQFAPENCANDRF